MFTDPNFTDQSGAAVYKVSLYTFSFSWKLSHHIKGHNGEESSELKTWERRRLEKKVIT